jgi:hypothetical protein
MVEGTFDLDRLVSAYVKIRDKKNEVLAQAREQEELLNLKLKKIEQALLEHCSDNGVESVRTGSGTFYRSVKQKFWTSDWESMNKFILEHEVPELLEKRIHQGNLKQFLEDNPDLLPPGLNCDSEYSVTVRRKR